MNDEETRAASSLDDYLQKLKNEALSNGYAYWAKQQYPIVHEDVFEGRETQVELDALEITPDYVLLSITASNSPRGWWVRKSVDIAIKRCS